MKCICDKSPAVRQVRTFFNWMLMMFILCDLTLQAAVYGIGVMAQCCAKDFSQTCIGQWISHINLGACLKYLNFLIEALPMLSFIISDSESRCDLPATNATENAISAVTKICVHLENQVPLETVLPVWLSWLPVYEDKEEAPHVYSYLCKQIEKYVRVLYICIS